MILVIEVLIEVVTLLNYGIYYVGIKCLHHGRKKETNIDYSPTIGP